MKVYAISDLHLHQVANRVAFANLRSHPEDWLILAGDIGETEGHLHYALSIATRCFARVIWVPGNHDLWVLHSSENGQRGEAKYQRLVSICRAYGVLTPEDPYIIWHNHGVSYCLVPLFVLYDYSFRPDYVPLDHALEWAAEQDLICSDEFLLHTHPYHSIAAWCAARCAYTEQRLNAINSQLPLVFINHFPLRQDLAYLPQIPRFSIWCGTRRTEDWLTRYHVVIAVYGHLHIRATYLHEGIRHEEVSLGYQNDWCVDIGINAYLREILPDRA